MPFRDILDITVQGGKGGDGGMSFLRLKYMPKGGPDGGNGGDGGSVYLRSINNVTSLDRLIGMQSYRAGTGMQGEGRDRDGAKGDDLIIDVPVGTTAYDAETGEVLADLLEVDQQVIVARGGLGGRGNAAFTTSKRRTPRFSEMGTKGEKRRIRLELRMIADVGLVGYPNAGKSSLLAVLSNAKPEIASYPFTTLSPNLGVVENNMERFTLADIPGIIEDAHKGKGLGFEFLRHISRTRLLIYVLDIADDPEATFEALQHELREYDTKLLELPSLIALNKIDLASEGEVAEVVSDLTQFGLAVMPISADEGTGLEELKAALFALLPEKPKLEPVAKGTTRIKADPIVVKRAMSGEGWIVTGEQIEGVIRRFDPSNKEVVAYLQHFFASMNINKLLKRAGAKNGDDVFIGEGVFEYFDEEQAKRAELDSTVDDGDFTDSELDTTQPDTTQPDDSEFTEAS